MIRKELVVIKIIHHLVLPLYILFLQEPSRINLVGKLTWKDLKQCGTKREKKNIPLADIINLNKKPQILELGKWMLTIHKAKKVYIPIIERQEIKMKKVNNNIEYIFINLSFLEKIINEFFWIFPLKKL